MLAVNGKRSPKARYRGLLLPYPKEGYYLMRNEVAKPHGARGAGYGNSRGAVIGVDKVKGDRSMSRSVLDRNADSAIVENQVAHHHRSASLINRNTVSRIVGN